MNDVRYILSILLLVTLPGAFLFWFVIHPFVAFWRRVGLWPAYVTSFGVMILAGLLVYRWHNALLGRDLGTSWIQVIVGLAIYAVAWTMERRVRRVLKLRTLVGVAELKNEGSHRMLTKGMFELVRHPRYLTISVGIVGWALICNYVGIYVLGAITIPMLYLIAILEERELVERFGDSYREYQKRVPRFFPSAAGLRRLFSQGTATPNSD